MKTPKERAEEFVAALRSAGWHEIVSAEDMGAFIEARLRIGGFGKAAIYIPKGEAASDAEIVANDDAAPDPAKSEAA